MDNCPRHYNPSQVDRNGNGNGDACDCYTDSQRLCLNGAYCGILQRDFMCYCTAGYTGENCDVDIDECQSDPCAAGSTCVDRLAMYECVCNNETSWGYRCNLSNPALIYVPENAQLMSVIGFLKPVDAEDLSYRQYFYSTSATSYLPFYVSNSSGQVVLVSPLDRETTPLYTLQLQVTTTNVISPQVSVSTSTDVEVIVEDINDNSPVFEQAVWSEVIDEDTRPGSPLLSVHATDVDYGSNGTVCYNMTAIGYTFPRLDYDVNGTEVVVEYDSYTNISGFDVSWLSGMVSIYSNNGTVVTDRKILWNRTSQIVYKVSATDGGSPPRTAIPSMLVINVTADNWFAPQCKNQSVTIPENSTIGTAIATVQASDSDVGPSGEVRYYISNAEPSPFDIDPVYGFVTIARSLDREAHPYGVKILVYAIDQAPPPAVRKESACPISVTLLDVNDNAPNFTENDLHLRLQSVVLGEVIYRSSASDPDLEHAGKISFDLYVDASNLFDVTPTGELSIVQQPPPIRPVSYYLLLRAIDNGTDVRLYSYKRVIVTLLDPSSPDMNEPVPLLVKLSVLENTAPGTLLQNATKWLERGGFPLAIMDGASTFRVRDSGSSGTQYIKLAGQQGEFLETSSTNIDYEKHHNLTVFIEFTVVLRATTFITTYKVEMAVIDENDNAPVFDQAVYRGVEMYGNRVDSMLKHAAVTVHATDADSGENGRIGYNLDASATWFKINLLSGEIMAKEQLPATVSGVQTFHVLVRDYGQPSLTSTASVQIFLYPATSFTTISLPCFVPNDNSTVQQIANTIENLRPNEGPIFVSIYELEVKDNRYVSG